MAELGFHFGNGVGGESLSDDVLQAGAAAGKAAAIWRQEELFPHPPIHRPGPPTWGYEGHFALIL